ncbi:MAG: tryptophan--tRNA ligase, partial [Haloplanus sp.]
MTRDTRDADSDPDDHSADSDANAGRPAPDGGSEAAGADEVALDPWGSSTVSDYRSLFDEFGIEEFDQVLADVPNPHYLMRRGVIFGHRDYRPIARALRDGEDAAVLSGFMPTGDPHIGHKLVFDEIIWHQERGADAYGLIADLEAHSARGLSWDEID